MLDIAGVRFDGQVAIVTGGGRGIGEGVALTLANFGADVAIADIDLSLAENAASQVRKLGRRALALHTDVRDEEQVNAMVRRTVEGLGRLDILVNNAGGTFHAPIMQISRRGWEALQTLNLTSVFLCSRAAAAYWLEKKIPGRIINVSSTEGMKACPGFTPYSAAKAGVINLTRCLAAELGPYGIRVNCIAPDYTPTPGTTGMGTRTPERDERVASLIPLQRQGTPDDMAGPVVFFASDLSRWVTGETMVVDGGALVAARVEGAFPKLPQDTPTR